MTTPSVLPRACAYDEADRADAALPLPSLIARVAAAHPDRIALRDATHTHTYAALCERVLRWARALRDAGVGPEVIVGLALERSAELVIAALAVLEAGGAYLPLDANLPAERLAFMLDDAGVRIVVTDTPARFPDRVVVSGPADSAGSPSQPVSPSQRAYLLYTSGSTGQPKAVEVEHAALSNLLVTVRRVSRMSPRDVFLATSALSFDVAAAELFVPLITGATTYVAARADLEDGARFDAAYRESGATFLQATPSGWRQLVRLGFAGSPQLTAFTVGEPLTRELADQVLARARTFYNFYGPTEATVYATLSIVARDGGEISIGAPLDEYEVIITGDDGAPVPRGVEGELRIGGVGLARGYLGRPELTREKFTGGYYRTGDRAVLREDGTLICLGRVDHQVKVRGYRIELDEIDAVLEREPEVHAAVTVKHPSGDKLVSYFVPTPSAATTGDAAFGRLYDEAYRRSDIADHAIAGVAHFSGYTSSYTGLPFPPDELAEHADTTVRRILGLSPQRVYEIGCGTGLIGTRLFPHVAHYRGSDLAAAAAQVLSEALGPRAEVWHGDARDFSRVPAGDVDLILLNSTIQYFPDVPYVVDVLDQALDRVAPGGVVFVGDVRHAGLAREFWRGVIAARAKAPLSAAELAERVEAALHAEKELLFDPRFFHAWAARRAEVADVRVELREGRAENELTRYRYDVIVRRRDAARVAGSDAAAVAGSDAAAVAPAIAPPSAAWPVAELASPMRIIGIPNARLRADGVHPDDLRARAAEKGLPFQLTFSDDPFLFDAIVGPPPPYAPPLGLAAPAAYVRTHRDVAREARLTRTLRESLAQKLPEYMVPAQLIALDAMPLNTAGKIDRARLPPPEAARPELAVPYAAPRTETERRVCAILERELGVVPVGLHDSFFDLGGNSIVALSVALDLQRELGRDVSVVAFLREPTAEKLARLVDGEASGLDPRSPLVPLVLEGARRPLFFLHSAGGRPHLLVDLVMQHRSDRPLYFLQDPAWTGQHARTTSIEEMATLYIRSIREIQPRGPYLLAGYCFGGIVGLEMAHQLARAGEQVSRLMMVDPSMPRTETASVAALMRTQLQAVGSYIPQLADKAYARLAARGGTLSRLAGRFLDDSRDRVEATRRLPAAATDILGAHGDTRTIVELMSHHVRLWANYRATPWSGRTAFALSTIPSAFNQDYPDDLLGWRPIIADAPAPEILRIPGTTHFDMGSRPQVFAVADFFKRIIAAADG